MKIGVIVETLRKPLREGIRTAAELGCEGIQFYGINPEFSLLEAAPEQVRELSGLAVGAALVAAPAEGQKRGTRGGTRTGAGQRR